MSSKKWHTALFLFRSMRFRGIIPNEKTYEALLHVCVVSSLGGRMRMALYLLDEAQRSLPLSSPTIGLWTEALRVCASVGDHALAHELIHRMEHRMNDPSTKDYVGPGVDHYNALLAALAKAGRDEEAHSVLERMMSKQKSDHRSKFTPNLVSFNTVLLAYARTGNYVKAKHLLQAMENESAIDVLEKEVKAFLPDVVSYNTVLSACRDSKEAIEILEMMEHSPKAKPTTVTYTNAISACRRSEPPDVKTAMNLIQKATEHNIQANVYMYSAAIWTAERHKDWHAASTLLESMKSSQHCSSNAVVYEGVISAHATCGKFHTAIELFQEMKDSDITPSSTVYQKLALAVQNSGENPETQLSALERILSMINDSSTTNVRTAKLDQGPIIASLIRSYGMVGNYQQAKNLFDSFCSTEFTDAACVSAILYVCSSVSPSPWEDAVDILHNYLASGANNRSNKQDSMALTYAVIACSKEDQWEEALNLVYAHELSGRSMEEKDDRNGSHEPGRRTIVTVDAMNSIIAACGRCGRADTSVKILNEMRIRHGVQPNARSYRSAIIACNQAEHELQHRLKKQGHLEEANGNNVEDSQHMGKSYGDNDVDPKNLNGLGLHWWECALSLLRRMQEDGLHPDSQIYSSVISACEAAGQWQRAIGILRSMLSSDTSVRFTSNDDFTNPSSSRNVTVVSKQSPLPNLFCLNAAISACEKGGAWLEALELYERVRAVGGAIQPNVVTVNSLLIALDRAGQRELAESIYDDALRSGLTSPWKPRYDSDGSSIRAMDLHQFSVPMARIAVRSAFESFLSNGKESQQHPSTNDLIIIVGKGKGSEDGKAALMPEIQKLLRSELDVSFEVEESNSGRIRVSAYSLQSFVERKSWRLP